jgi:hypothetical protein
MWKDSLGSFTMSDKVQDFFTILHEDIKGRCFFESIWGIQQYRLCVGSFEQIKAFKFSELVKIHIYTPLPILETTDRNHYHLQVFDCRKGNKWGINAFSFVYFCSIAYFHIKRQSKFMKHYNYALLQNVTTVCPFRAFIHMNLSTNRN